MIDIFRCFAIAAAFEYKTAKSVCNFSIFFYCPFWLAFIAFLLAGLLACLLDSTVSKVGREGSCINKQASCGK